MNNIINKTEHTIKYHGEVSIYLERNNKKTLLNKSSNLGGSDLFHFFSECLAGNYSVAESYRPTKIKLFENTSTYTDAKADPWIENKVEDRSDIIYYDESPKVAKEIIQIGVTGKTKDIWSTVIHFRIPFTLLKTDATHYKINQLALYSGNGSGDGSTFSAVYLLHNNTDTEWAPIDTSTLGKNFGLIVEWTLKVEDKTASSAE